MSSAGTWCSDLLTLILCCILGGWNPSHLYRVHFHKPMKSEMTGSRNLMNQPGFSQLVPVAHWLDFSYKKKFGTRKGQWKPEKLGWLHFGSTGHCLGWFQRVGIGWSRIDGVSWDSGGEDVRVFFLIRCVLDAVPVWRRVNLFWKWIDIYIGWLGRNDHRFQRGQSFLICF